MGSNTGRDNIKGKEPLKRGWRLDNKVSGEEGVHKQSRLQCYRKEPMVRKARDQEKS